MRRAVKLKEFFQTRLIHAPYAVPSLYDFLKEAWKVIEPGVPFTKGWHLEAICEHLEAVADGDIKRLIINIPPRHSKSTLVSVIWPVWQWLKAPSTQFLCASYALSLAIRDNRKSRLLIQSPWFQSVYGSAFTMSSDQNMKSYFENSSRGYRLAVSTGSAATGHGGSILIGDDLHAIDEKESDVARESCLDWFDTTFSTRLNNPQTGAIVVIGQRIHEMDISGHLIDQGGWEHLCLPAEYERDRKCSTSIGWSDPRTEEGELLWKERFHRETLAQQKRNLGVLGYSALYGQRPIPPGGYVFNASYERLFTISPEQDMYQLVTPSGVRNFSISDCWELSTSDVAAKAKEANDFTVFAHWAVTPEHDVLLLDLWRGHWTIPQQKEKARMFYRTHYSQRYRAFYFEDVGYQSAIGQDLLVEGLPCMEFHPEGDKVLRAGGASIYQEAGKIFFLKGAIWLEDFRKEIYTFPKSAKDDQVDNLSMICMIVREPVMEFGPINDEVANLLLNYQGY
jgi:predicted phage terminase large subunit-like protein